ncbi:MAG: rod shape-determining protein MreD [Firmicutes bacterium]|nr:rod shape-determining protein MreD [Bacillota bacterium]
MGTFIYTLIISISLVIQTTIFSMWPFLRVAPDLLLVFTVIFGLLNGPKFGAKFGFGAGLALDLLSGNLIGWRGITRMLVGIGVGTVSSRVYKENYVIPFICIILATVLETSIYFAGVALFNQGAPWLLAIQEVLLPLIIYNAIICLLFYVRLYYLNKKIFYWDELFRRAR